MIAINRLIIVAFVSTLANSQRILDSRIVGGFPANPDAVQHQVSIRLKKYDKTSYGNGFSCGGSLISELSVVTAAHCMHTKERNYRPDEFKIVLGSLYLNERSESTLTRYVSKILIHPKYNDLEHDVAIMILNQVVPINQTIPAIRPIPLAKKHFVTGTVCQVTGWGSTSFNGHPSNKLLSANVSIIDTQLCNNTKSYDGLILHGMICAGNLTAGGVDACQGDSGGPLICNGTLAGIISWGMECGLKRHPGVYADIVHYRSWILKNNTNNIRAVVSTIFCLILFVVAQ